MERRKRIKERILISVGMAACVVAILYPLLSNCLYSRRQDKIITEYSETIMQMDTEWIRKEREACEYYNQKIVQNSTVVTDATGAEEIYGGNFKLNFEEYEARLNPEGNGVMGYVVIPKIEVHLPVYHFATDEVLDSGVGHLPESSLPVGGEGCHCVLTGHTGSTGKKIFTDLALMKMGDIFYLNILGEMLVYQVDRIMTVLPYEVDELMVREGEDLCTLVTCTPYGINSHRLLVRGRRVEINEAPEIEYSEIENEGMFLEKVSERKTAGEFSLFLGNYLRSLLLGGVLAGVSFAVIKKLRKNRGEKE